MMESTTEVPTIDMTRLRARVAGRITLEDGTVHDVMKAKRRHYKALRALQAENATDALFTLAGQCAPTLTQEQLDDFEIEDAQVVLSIAMGDIKAVEATLLPNGASPATDSSTSPG